MEPRLSIVVPFYGVEAYIADCLRSLARQTFEDFEVVLIDDGSPDGSAAIARHFVERDPRFRMITQENQGLGPARNNGVTHSVGEYLAFVDSDDLVPRRAYELLVRTLDETGSSFAGGDVRRLNSAGSRESLVHRAPFARDRRATHVLEFPELAIDRMVWNKVYRRCFWDEFGYEFPAMRYEDYPVTLRAHLDAVTVDCLAAPVYLWHERDSGESITDQSHDFANLQDRVTCAEMVIDLLSRRAPELAPRVHRHLVRVDLAVLLQAFRAVSVDDEERYVALGQRFVNRIDVDALPPTRRFDRLQIHALRTGDAVFLRELVAFGSVHGLDWEPRAKRRRLMPWRHECGYPGSRDWPRRAPRSMYRLRDEDFVLRTTVTDIRWHHATLVLRGTAEIRHLHTGERSRLLIHVTADEVVIPCDVTRFPALDSGGEVGLVGFEARIDGTAFAKLPSTERAVDVSVQVVNGRFRRGGPLRGLQPGSPHFASGNWVGEKLWLQPRPVPGGRLALELIDDPPRLTSAEVHDDEFVLAGVMPGDAPATVLSMIDSSTAAVRTVKLDLSQIGPERCFSIRLPIAELVDGIDPEDPLEPGVTWVLRPADNSDLGILLPTGLAHGVGVRFRSLLVMLTRSQANSAAFHVSSARTIVDEVVTDTAGSRPRLVARGRLFDSEPARTFVWRRCLEGSDETVDVGCRFSISGEHWSAAADVGDLTTQEVRRSATPATWTLLTVTEDGRTEAVRAEHFLSSQLPVDLALSERTAMVLPVEGLLRVVVR